MAENTGHTLKTLLSICVSFENRLFISLVCWLEIYTFGIWFLQLLYVLDSNCISDFFSHPFCRLLLHSVQKPSSFMEYHLSILLIISWGIRVFSRKFVPISISWSVSPYQFQYLKSYIKIFEMFSLICVQTKTYVTIFIFCIWIPSFPNTICWMCCLFPQCIFRQLYQKRGGCSYVSFFLRSILYSTGLHTCFCGSAFWLCHHGSVV